MAQLTLGTSVAITPALAAVNGTPTALSTDVASHFGKPHYDVLKVIDKLVQELPTDRHGNFSETVTERPNPAGGAPIQSRAYRLTRDGFTLLAMGFTGKKALAFKLAYLDAFNRMEAELAGRPQHPVSLHTSADLLDMLGLASSIARLVQQQMFTTLVAQGPLPMSNLPTAVRPLVHQKAAEIAAQALPHITHWLATKIAKGHDTTTQAGIDNMLRHAPNTLRHYGYESWLSEGKTDMARSMVALFSTMKDMATENEAAVLAQLSQLLASPQQPAIGQAGSAQARIGGEV